jgi:hypothetical protein
MSSFTRLALLWAAALAAPTVLCLALVLARREPPAVVGDDWSPERLREELAARGLLYEGREVTVAEAHQVGLEPGYYLKRPQDPRAWEELARQLRAPATGSMRGYVVVTASLEPALPPPLGWDPQEGSLLLGRLFLLGDPAELRRILEALGRPVECHRPDGVDPWHFGRRW